MPITFIFFSFLFGVIRNFPACLSKFAVLIRSWPACFEKANFLYAGPYCNFQALQNLWKESLEYVKESEMRARIGGVSDRMMKSDFFFGVMLGQTVLSYSDNSSRTLQKGDISASEGQDTAEMILKINI